MEHLGIKPTNIYLNVNNLGLPDTGTQLFQKTSQDDPYDILDMRDQSFLLHQPSNNPFTNMIMQLMLMMQSLISSIKSRFNDDTCTPPPPPYLPGFPLNRATLPDWDPCSPNPFSSIGDPLGSLGSNPKGFSTKPQTRAYTQDETRAMGKQITESLMRDLGITRNQAAGIVGNLMQESGLNPAINQGGKIGKPDPCAPGYGWVQWSGPRRKEYENFARQQGLDPGSPAANYAFLIKELKGPYSGVLNHLKQTHTVADAARVIFAEYEIPGDGSLPTRINYANRSLGWV